MYDEDIDVVEIKTTHIISKMSFGVNKGKGKAFASHSFDEPLKLGEIWIPAAIVKRAKNGSVYACTQDYYDSNYPMKRWYKKGEWREK